ncbi:MAG: transglycosylase domain-containing protein [Holosporales bacterium]|nr:transglycosylase domain-containing protein [Holosporales bacterium]
MSRRRGTRSRYQKKKTIFSILFKYFVYTFFAGFAVVACALFYFSKDLPDLNNLKTTIRNPAVVVQTYDGAIIGAYGDLYEDVVMVEDLPRYVPEAFMSVEDRRFFYHFGIDFIGFFRAMYKNLLLGKVVEGGSTITQQLAKNILIGEGVVTHYDKSVVRKIKELLLAMWLEHKFTKSNIMMMYLNRVYFGAGAYGIDAASRKYFNKQARDMTIYEAALLAGLLKAPSRYNPASNSQNAQERARVVLEAMESQKFIENAEKIAKEGAKKVFSGEKKTDNNYMYFCDYVYDQAKKILGDIEDDIVVVSTFDIGKQKAAEEAVQFYINTESKRYNFSEAASVCIGRDGKIMAMVGGRSYSKSQFNRVTQALRMPGSAFKIFVYGAALEYGYQVDDMISDAPITIGNWTAKNYKWRSVGQLSLLDAFTHSVNSSCIRLAKDIGIKRVAKFANKLGIGNVSRHDMSVAIGTTPVTLKDLTCAYATFMDGTPIWSYAILEIRTKDGKILYERDANDRKSKVIDEETLENCRILLRTVVRRGTGRAANVNEHVYGKSGSNGDDDAWFICFYDPDNPEEKDKGFACGVWIGNDNNKVQMTHDSTGGRIPARIAARFMKNVLQNYVEEEEEDESPPARPKKSALDSVLDSVLDAALDT